MRGQTFARGIGVRAAIGALGIVSLLAGCSQRSLRIPIAATSQQAGNYVLSLSGQATSDSTLQCFWLAEASGGNRIWTAEVLTSGRTPRLRGATCLVDSGNTRLIVPFLLRGRPGVAYDKDDQLMYRWPLGAAPRSLKPDFTELPWACAAATLADGSVLLLATQASVDSEGVGRNITAFRLTGTGALRTKIARLHLRPQVTPQPAAALVVDGQRVRATLLLCGGRVVNGESLESPFTRSDFDEVQLVTIGLSLAGDGHVVADSLRVREIPHGDGLQYTESFALISEHGPTFLAGRPRPQIVQCGENSIRAVRLSSATGTGGIYSQSTVAVVPVDSGRLLAVWIDTASHFGFVPTFFAMSDRTVDGGELDARLLGADGAPTGAEFRPFPIHTRAQAVWAGRVGPATYLAWAEARRRFGRGLHPTDVRIMRISGN